MQTPIFYLTTPSDVINQSLDMIGATGKIIGDINDGTAVSETARRNYGQVLRQLLRTAHWMWARKNAKLVLLGDSTGQTPNVSKFVECPWTYAWAWPTDAVQGRWMPFNYPGGQPDNSQGVPLTTGNSGPLVPYQLTPARFLVSSSDQYPIEIGLIPWIDQPDLQRTEGVGPTSRKIILSDCCNAWFVYTRLVTEIEVWDNLFRQAMVSLMALALIPVAIDDPKERLTQRNAMIAIAKNAIAEARVANGQEAGWPQTVDFEASFIRARSYGSWGGLGGDSFGSVGGVGIGGSFFNGFETMNFCGSVF